MTDGWDNDLQDLADEYSPGYVITAFAVKETMEEEGRPGIHFTETTEAYLRKIGPMIVKNKVEKHMNRELRKRGLQ
jgi:hypothetical protein